MKAFEEKNKRIKGFYHQVLKFKHIKKNIKVLWCQKLSTLDCFKNFMH